MTWLTAKAALGLARYWWILIAIAAVTGLWFAYTATLDRMTETAKDAGAVEQREADLTETLNRTEQGNAAREEVRREVDAGSGSAVYTQCLRTARTPENCLRFLPKLEAD